MHGHEQVFSRCRLLLLSLLALLVLPLSSAVRVPIKINVGPSPLEPALANAPGRSSYAPGARQTKPAQPPPVSASRAPANFSLPPPIVRVVHLQKDGEEDKGAEDEGDVSEVDVRFDAAYEEALWRRLDGHCSVAQLGRYRYSFCPFHNVTQKETQGPFEAVLGSWSGWWLTPSLQLAMSFTHGTPCNDDVDRSVVAVLQCSLPPHAPSSVPLSILAAAERAPPHVADVVEPSMCSYELHYHTPLVCALYDRVRAEAEWRWRHPSTPISRLRRRRDADDDSAAIDAQDEADERRLAAWRATWPSEAPAAAAASADERSEIRDLLACIAGMSMDGATHSTYAALCAPFLQSAEPIAATNSTANASGQR